MVKNFTIMLVVYTFEIADGINVLVLAPDSLHPDISIIYSETMWMNSPSFGSCCKLQCILPRSNLQ